MTNDDLKNKVIAELDKRFGISNKYRPEDPSDLPCTIVVEGPDGSPAIRSLNFGEVADAAIEAFKSLGDNT